MARAARRVPFLGPKKLTVMKVKGVMKLPNSLVILHLKGELSFKMKKLPNCWVISYEKKTKLPHCWVISSHPFLPPFT